VPVPVPGIVPGQGAGPRSVIAPDLATTGWTEELARSLAPLEDPGSTARVGLPDQVALLDLLSDGGSTPTDPGELARRWTRDPHPGPVAVLGATTDGRFRIDLRRDGPHILVAGTTGAGKSELLRTLITALAVECPPTHVSFMLIDYKGGSAFRECAALPHVAGVLTDLDAELAARALSSLGSELRRRERLLAGVGVADLIDFQQARKSRSELPEVARLVVIVDEFRVLAEDLPDFVSGLVRIATVGRSLGVHLVLATQRPAGVISAEIRANVNLRIALRVRDAADSLDVIDLPDAAALPGSLPGRGLARCGGGEPVSFQTALLGAVATGPDVPAVRRRDQLPGARRRTPQPGWTPDPPPRSSVAGRPLQPPSRTTGPQDPAGQEDHRSGPAPAATPRDGLAVLVRATHTAADRLGLRVADPPWLPPLPDRILRTSLADPRDADVHAAEPQHRPNGLAFGLADRPEDRRQDSAVWWLAGRNFGVLGGPRSGRSTAIRTLAEAALWRADPIAREPRSTPPLHVYVIDAGAALWDLAEDPQVGAVMPARDVERCGRLLAWMSREVVQRQTGPASASRDADLLLLIDGWEAVHAEWLRVEHGRLLDQLMEVLRDGPAIGIHTVIAGGRMLLGGPIAGLLAERLVLGFADPTDAVMAGVPTIGLSRRQRPGRGVFLSSDGTHQQVQVALPTAWPPDVARHPMTGPPPRPVATLPNRVRHRELLAAWQPAPGAGAPGPDGGSTGPTDLGEARPGSLELKVPIGIGGDDAGLRFLDLTPGAITTLVGPAGSGRSSALTLIGWAVSRLGHRVIRLPIGESGPPPAPGPACSRTVVLLDDLGPDRPDPTTEATLLEHLRHGRETGTTIVLATTPTALLSAYGGLLGAARAGRTGLVLGGIAPGEGDLLSRRLPPRPAGPPGRALLVMPGGLCPVQLAEPPPERAAEPQQEPSAPSPGLLGSRQSRSTPSRDTRTAMPGSHR
jgi:S-DNA-T family DNA segregation ATPase FtsK/SpoIIIE